MKKYKVIVADRFTKIPLKYYDVLAFTKWGAKAKIFNTVCGRDRSYLLFAYKEW